MGACAAMRHPPRGASPRRPWTQRRRAGFQAGPAPPYRRRRSHHRRPRPTTSIISSHYIYIPGVLARRSRRTERRAHAPTRHLRRAWCDPVGHAIDPAMPSAAPTSRF